MKLSILIPVYNFDASQLISDLHEQAVETGIPFEIVVFDDHSTDFVAENMSSIALLSHARYLYLPTNLGRAGIRNLLAEEANHSHLLFLDGDSGLPDSTFLSKYIKAVQNDPNAVWYGGTAYAPQPPEDGKGYLRWYYGKQREESSAEARSKQPAIGFKTNNFLIPKSIFEQVKFDETITQYGHEDTLFAHELEALHIPIKHLNNPVLHLGLEEDEVFLKKCEVAVKTLFQVIQDKEHARQLANDFKLLRTFNMLKGFGLDVQFRKYLTKRKARLKQKILAKPPSLRSLDLYKLCHLLELDHQQRVRRN